MSFDGLRVLSLESRRAVEIEVLIRKQEGDPFVAPSVKERSIEDHGDAFRLLEGIEQKAFDLLILMTGVGLAFWRDQVGNRYSLGRADEALRSIKLLSRGPKPSALLRSVGLTPDITIPEPNTWREVVESIRSRTERRLAIQEYGRPNREFSTALEDIGASVSCFALYRWELPEDLGPLREAVERLRSRQVDVVLFTSSVQLEHLIEVAQSEGARKEVLDALRSGIVIASIGPIMNEALKELGLTAEIVPSSPKMGALVKAAADQSAALVSSKRFEHDRTIDQHCG